MKYAIILSAICVMLLALSFPKVADSRAKSHFVHASFAGFEVNTRLDSAVASQLVNDNGRQLPEAVSADLRTRLSCRSSDELPDAHALLDITSDYSTDTATALLIQCLSTLPRIQKSQQLFLSELALRRKADLEQAAFLATKANEYIVLVVPGWGYQSNADVTGADLATPREVIAGLGFENHLVAVKDTGSVDDGAKILVATVNKYLHSKKKIILVSASSGGPIVALALNDPAIATQPQLVGWLNICGVLRGTPVIDTFLSWPKSLLLRMVALYEGWDYTDLLSLSRVHSKPRYDKFIPPTQLTIVNYIGIPFSGQVSELGQDFYSMLKAEGPNDGLTLILDALAPGYTIMAVGLDHFVNNDPEIDIKTAALLPVMMKLIED
jgi:hypothetical protein